MATANDRNARIEARDSNKKTDQLENDLQALRLEMQRSNAQFENDRQTDRQEFQDFKTEMRLSHQNLMAAMARLTARSEHPDPGGSKARDEERRGVNPPIEVDANSSGAQPRYRDLNLDRTVVTDDRFDRVECPSYDGTTAFKSWLYKCEQYLEYNRVPANRMIRSVYYKLDGMALEWHQSFMEDKQNCVVSWDEYVRNMSLRFDSGRNKDPMVQLKKLLQHSSVENYQKEFESIRFQARCSEAHALSMFMGGLKEKLHSFVSLHKPRTVMEAFEYATLYEEALNAEYSSSSDHYNQKPYTTTQRNQQALLPTPANDRPPPLMNQGTNGEKAKKYRRMSDSEHDHKVKNKLCFFCDEKYEQGHSCERRRLNNMDAALMVDEEIFVEVTDQELNLCEMEQANHNESLNCVYAGNELPVHNTPKVCGWIGGISILTLLDSGSSLNIINAKTVKELRCEIEEVKAFKVALADGKQVSGHLRCKGLEWEASGVVFRVNALILPLSEYDLILGMEWLESLGNINWDFKNKMLQFEYEKQQIQLQVMSKLEARWMKDDQSNSALEKEDKEHEKVEENNVVDVDPLSASQEEMDPFEKTTEVDEMVFSDEVKADEFYYQKLGAMVDHVWSGRVLVLMLDGWNFCSVVFDLYLVKGRTIGVAWDFKKRKKKFHIFHGLSKWKKYVTDQGLRNCLAVCKVETPSSVAVHELVIKILFFKRCHKIHLEVAVNSRKEVNSVHTDDDDLELEGWNRQVLVNVT